MRRVESWFRDAQHVALHVVPTAGARKEGKCAAVVTPWENAEAVPVLRREHRGSVVIVYLPGKAAART